MPELDLASWRPGGRAERRRKRSMNLVDLREEDEGGQLEEGDWLTIRLVLDVAGNKVR